MDDKWMFFYNGYTWWLRISTPEQLARYCELTDSDRFGGAMMEIANHRMSHPNEHWGGLPYELDALNRCCQENLLTTVGTLVSDVHSAYFKTLKRCGFVNINRLGGCNGMSWPMNAVVYRDKLIFPKFTREDVVIKTWEWEDKKQYIHRPGYQYHWYVYIGDVQLKDGDKDKWDTRAEAEAFVDRLFPEIAEENGPRD